MQINRVDEHIASTQDKPIASTPNSSTRNSSKIWNEDDRNVYRPTLVAAASWLSPMLRLPKRLSMSRKKSSLGKSSFDDIVLPVVACKRSPKSWLLLTHTGLREAGFRRPTVPPLGACRRTGWRRRRRRRNELERGGRIWCLVQARIHVCAYIARFGKVVGHKPCMSPRSRKIGTKTAMSTSVNYS